jgi:hypothetical protein
MQCCWYRDFLAINPERQANGSPKQYADDLQALNRIEAEVARFSVLLQAVLVRASDGQVRFRRRVAHPVAGHCGI